MLLLAGLLGQRELPPGKYKQGTRNRHVPTKTDERWQALQARVVSLESGGSAEQVTRNLGRDSAEDIGGKSPIRVLLGRLLPSRWMIA